MFIIILLSEPVLKAELPDLEEAVIAVGAPVVLAVLAVLVVYGALLASVHVERAAAVKVSVRDAVALIARVTARVAFITVRELVPAANAVADSVVVLRDHAVSTFNTFHILPLVIRQNRIIADLDLQSEGVSHVGRILALLAARDQLIAGHAFILIIYIDVMVTLAVVRARHLPPTCLLVTNSALPILVHGCHLYITDIAPILLVALSTVFQLSSTRVAVAICIEEATVEALRTLLVVTLSAVFLGTTMLALSIHKAVSLFAFSTGCPI